MTTRFSKMPSHTSSCKIQRLDLIAKALGKLALSMKRKTIRETNMEFKAQGNKLYSQGKTQDAVRAYTQGLDLVEEGGGEGATEEDRGCLHLLYSNRSMAHLDLCLVDEALQDAECAIDANPEYGKAYARRAAVMVDLWNFKEALQDLDKAEDLDPSLTESLAELRLRAQGKKWVPNCYLQKQIEMRKKHKCDYVAMFELESGDEIVEPVFLRRAEDKTALAIGDARPVLRALILTGDGGIQTQFLLSNIEGAIRQKLEQGKLGEKSQTRRKMLKAQLRREFGPITDEMRLHDGKRREFRLKVATSYPRQSTSFPATSARCNPTPRRSARQVLSFSQGDRSGSKRRRSDSPQ